MPVVYRGVRLDCGYRMDLIVDDDVVVEVKAVSRIEPIHEAQLISLFQVIQPQGWPPDQLQHQGVENRNSSSRQ